MSNIKLSNETVKNNINLAQTYLNENGLEGIYISSFDEFINEYVPMENCHRFFYTGFSGSTAEMFIPKSGKVKLYVDGRYHEQADLECDLAIVDIIKVPLSDSVMSVLKRDLIEAGYKKIACEGERTAVDFYEFLNSHFDLVVVSDAELSEAYKVEKASELGPIKQLDVSLTGGTISEKLNRIFSDEGEAYFINAIDTLSWLTNCRGYHLPNLSSFLGKGVAVRDKVFVFIDSSITVECEDELVEFVHLAPGVIEKSVQKIVSHYNIQKFYVDKESLNASDFISLNKVVAKQMIHNPDGLISVQAQKTEGEIKAIKDSFKKSDKAIFDTLCWVKSMINKGEEVSEKDLYLKTSEMYKNQGAITQSFNTIAGVDANGSIIHYSDPKDSVKITKESMCLLDSGGYFEPGFATDTTRTFMGGSSEGNEKQKRIYTYTLKGVLQLQNAVFKPGTRGSGLDAICRQPLHKAGYDFAHSTGHGVGVHVHEGGTGIGSTRTFLMKPGHVVSIEPGIYIPGFGGVRIENIAVIVEHPLYDGMLKFEPLVYIGYEQNLIDESLLTAEEKVWLEEYEAECVKRGTSFLLV